MSLQFRIEDRKLLQRLQGLQGPKERSKARRSVSRSIARVVVPAMRANVPHKYGGHPGRYDTRGKNKPRTKYDATKGELARKVSVRVIRTRPGEAGAWSIKSRAWFAHIVTRGSKPHVIAIGDLFGRASNRIVRQINRGERSLGAMYFNGSFVYRVEHPGAAPNPWVRLTLRDQSLGAQVTAQLGKDLMEKS